MPDRALRAILACALVLALSGCILAASMLGRALDDDRGCIPANKAKPSDAAG